jgi:chorismate-pyruvate lyase
MSVERQLFPDGPQHAPWLRALLALDGSTTRVCEAVAQQPVVVQLHVQRQTDDVPAAVREQLGGHRWLERITSLHAHGRVMMDNLSYTRLDAVPDWFLAGLDAGQAPVGHLLQKLFVRRESVAGSAALSEVLWSCVGQPDTRASRNYRVVTPSTPLMQIFEVYRDGMVREDRP